MQLSRAIITAALPAMLAASALAAKPASGPATPPVDPAIAGLAKDLGSDNSKTRKTAIDRLEKLGPSVIPAVDEAIDQLDKSEDDKDAGVFRRARIWSGWGAVVRDYGAAAIPYLLREIESESDSCTMAAQYLADMGKDAASTVPELARLAQSKSLATRLVALNALEELARYDPKDALPVLIQILKGADSPERFDAILAIRNMGPAAAAAFEPLCNFLKTEKDGASRQYVYQAIAKIADPKKSVPVLLAGVHDADPDAREGVAMGFGFIGTRAEPEVVIPALMALLGDSKSQFDAARALGMFGRAAVEPCVKALQSHDPVLRRGAAEALGQCNVSALGVLPVLIGHIRDPDVEVARAAITGIGQLWSLAAPAVPELVRELEFGRPELRESLMQALGRIGPPAAPAIRPLVRLLGDSDNEIRRDACWAIGDIHAEPKVAIPALLEIIKTDPGLASTAMGAAGEYKADAADCLPSIIFAARQFDISAVAALRKIGWSIPLGIEALVEVGQSSPPDVLFAVVNNLAAIDPPIAEAGPIYAKALNDRDHPDGHAAAILGLMSLNVTENSPQGQSLVSAMRDPDADTRLFATAAVARMRGDHAGALKTLAALATQSYPDETFRLSDSRIASLMALRRFYPAAEQTTRVLQTNLEKASGSLKLHTLGLIGEMGPGGRDWIPLIRPVLHGSDRTLRLQAALTIRKLDSTAELNP
ncbi:MAG TPA: HEAT repeat domain-containing protein [Tepidisphaeraceae bacterium]|jgi:HEAT repeat protein|nr:HEAT repeat domain-containing protein [Tepidisphaeraceae bacterium]